MPQSPEVVGEVLLEAIRRVIRDDESGMSKKPILLPHLDITERHTASTGSNIDDQKVDESPSSTLNSDWDLVSIDRDKVNSEGNVKHAEIVEPKWSSAKAKTADDYTSHRFSRQPSLRGFKFIS